MSPFYEAIINAGISAVLLVILLVGLYKLADKYLGKFVDAQLKQTVAIQELTSTLKENMTRDNNEHREIVLLLKVMNDKLSRIEDRKEKDEPEEGKV